MTVMGVLSGMYTHGASGGLPGPEGVSDDGGFGPPEQSPSASNRNWEDEDLEYQEDCGLCHDGEFNKVAVKTCGCPRQEGCISMQLSTLCILKSRLGRPSPVAAGAAVLAELLESSVSRNLSSIVYSISSVSRTYLQQKEQERMFVRGEKAGRASAALYLR